MDVLEAIKNRRSIRRYAARPVDKAVLHKLLEIAVQAPSAGNSQPWAFGVIEDPDLLRSFSERAKQYSLDQFGHAQEWATYRTMLTNPSYNMFYNAPAVVSIYAGPATGPWAAGDCAMAAMAFMLAARDMGLGSCWIGFAQSFFDSAECKAELGVPADYVSVVQMTLGYPEGEFPDLTARKDPRVLYWR